MKIITKVSNEVLEIINNEGVCYAKNDTSFSDYAYDYLKEITGYKGLFFGMLENDYMKENEGRIEEITSLSSLKNEITLTLEIPTSEYFAHDYYSFTDLAYFSYEEEFETVDLIKSEFEKPQLKEEVQCVFNRIEKDWIKKIH